jgi:alpha-methylacyl-CoA racemase
VGGDEVAAHREIRVTEASPPLAGLKIIDLSLLLPGPLATRHLLELGADVLKIEPPGEGDGTRYFWASGADVAAGRPSGFFDELNAGKTQRRIDLRSEAGRDELLALVRDADALVEGFRPGVMQRLGLGWERLHAINPRLVVCAITGYGQRGPYALRAGHDINYLALAGVLGQIASTDGAPALPNFQIADLLGGTQAAVNGILAGLLGAQRTGIGRFVDVSMTHEVYRHAVIARYEAAALGSHAVGAGKSLLAQGVACYGVYRTADGRLLAVGALEAKFWTALCDAAGRPDWAARHWTRGEAPGSARALATRDELAALLATRTLAEWMAVFEPADCCVTPVLGLDEVESHPWRQGA